MDGQRSYASASVSSGQFCLTRTIPQPVIHHTKLIVGHGGNNTSTAIVPTHDDVLDLTLYVSTSAKAR
jgi:hypothetical protein